MFTLIPFAASSFAAARLPAYTLFQNSSEVPFGITAIVRVFEPVELVGVRLHPMTTIATRIARAIKVSFRLIPDFPSIELRDVKSVLQPSGY
jgi:hypothetical protein